MTTRSWLAALRSLPVFLGIAACGGGGGGGGGSSPASPVALSFPADEATTTADTITIRGVVRLSRPIDAVRVNDVDATTTDGFATFTAEIPVGPGTHDVVVAVERPNAPATTVTFARRVTRIDPFAVEPGDVAFDATHHRLVMVDRAARSLIAVNVRNGRRVTLSDLEHGLGAPLLRPESLDLDATGAVAFVFDRKVTTIVAVDLVHGDRTALSGGTAGSGPAFGAPRGLAFDPDSERLLVADPQLAAVLAVDVATGDRTILSDDAHGAGTSFLAPVDVAFDTSSHRALVTDSSLRALVAVDLTTGDRTVVSDFAHGTGENFEAPEDVSWNGFLGVAVVSDTVLERVVLVEAFSGNRSILVDDEQGGGTEIGRPVASAADQNDGTLLVVDEDEDKIVRLKPPGFARDVLAGLPRIGSGPPLERAGRVAFDPAARRAWITTEDPPAVVLIDLATGDRTTFSDANHGKGAALVEPTAIALDAGRGRLLVADDFDDSLWAVSLQDGSRTLLSIETVGPGGDLHRTVEIVQDEKHARVLLMQSEDLILAVDLAHGKRSEFSFDDPAVPDATRMDGGVLDSANDRLLVHDQEIGLFAVGLGDGARTLVSNEVGNGGQDGGSGLATDLASDRILITPRAPLVTGIGAVDLADGHFDPISTDDSPQLGRGPTLHKAVTLAFDVVNGVVVVFDQASGALFEVDLASGDRVILSR